MNKISWTCFCLTKVTRTKPLGWDYVTNHPKNEKTNPGRFSWYNQRSLYIIYYSQFHSLLGPTGPPLSLNHSTPNPITLTLTWSPPDPSYRNGVLRGYMVVITELETSWTQQFNTFAPPLSIPSLHPFYTYNCTVSAYTVGLPGPYSPPYLVRMPQSGEWYLMEQCCWGNMYVSSSH